MAQHGDQQTVLPQYRPTFPGEKFLYGGLSNAMSGVCTNPADVLKVRMQMYKGADGRPASAVSMVRSIWQTEGHAAFMSGWQASVMREMSYSSIRMGLYDECKEILAGAGDDKFTFPLWKKIVAGGFSGCIGAAIANPTDLLKVRAQAINPDTGKPFYSYPNPWKALGEIFRNEGGLAGLYRGVVPTTQRAIILTATQFATYDEMKYMLLRHDILPEGLASHLVSSILAGLAVATTTNPVDLVKSRYMNQPFDMVTGRGHLYSGVVDCLRKTVAAEGLRGLYKGWLPNWARIGPHTVITFLCFETMRKLAGIAPV